MKARRVTLLEALQYGQICATSEAKPKFEQLTQPRASYLHTVPPTRAAAAALGAPGASVAAVEMERLGYVLPVALLQRPGQWTWRGSCVQV